MLAYLIGFADGEGLNALLDFRPGAGIWTWVALIVALPVMWSFVYGPITKALEERDRSVDEAREAAEAARKAAEEQVAAAKAELETARADSKRMVADATERAQRQADEALRQAKEEAARQLEKARADIESEKARALSEIRREVVDLSIAATGNLLKRDVDDESHRKIVEEFVGKVGS